MDHDQLMTEALAEARRGLAMGEVPIGAVIFLGGEIIGRGFNHPINAIDPTAHAEIVAMLVAAPLFAQAPVVASTDPESLFTSPDPKLNTNKQAAMHIERDLLEGGHWADAPMWLTAEYIQHNPAIVSGRESVMKFFGARPPGQIPARNAWRTKVVSVTAEGDDVVVAG